MWFSGCTAGISQYNQTLTTSALLKTSKHTENLQTHQIIDQPKMFSLTFFSPTWDFCWCDKHGVGSCICLPRDCISPAASWLYHGNRKRDGNCLDLCQPFPSAACPLLLIKYTSIHRSHCLKRNILTRRGASRKHAPIRNPRCRQTSRCVTTVSIVR